MLSARVRCDELMDDPSVRYEEFEQTLKQLRTLNVLSNVYRPTWRAVEKLARNAGSKSLRVLDLGCGYGDVLREMRRRAAQAGLTLECTGVDINPWARVAAVKAAPEGGIEYVTSNVFDLGADARWDIIISSLFFHHLDDEDIVRLLKWISDHAVLGWYIDDLQRHWLSYGLIHAIVRLGRYNRLVRHDGPVSVAQSFTRSDWHRYAERAGLDAIAIRWHWAFRYGVLYEASSP